MKIQDRVLELLEMARSRQQQKAIWAKKKLRPSWVYIRSGKDKGKYKDEFSGAIHDREGAWKVERARAKRDGALPYS